MTQYVIVSLVVLAAVAYTITSAVKTIRRTKRSEKCAGCPMKDTCSANHCHKVVGGCCH